jgi:hypothetical protein
LRKQSTLASSQVSSNCSPTPDAEATLQTNTNDVKLSGKFIKGRESDLPTMIWLPEIVEPAENFSSFFERADNKIS